MLRTLSGRYKPFLEVTQDALRFAAAKLDLRMTEPTLRQLMNQYACLSPFPENLPTLRTLCGMDLPLAVLSNGTPEMLEVAIRSAGMQGLFKHVLSVDPVKAYKVAPDAYAVAPRTLRLPARDILFVSSNGWDVAGAGWFGLSTFWINRYGQPPEQLDITPDGCGTQLSDVLDYIRDQHAVSD